jgi:predicted Zn-dependent protease
MIDRAESVITSEPETARELAEKAIALLEQQPTSAERDEKLAHAHRIKVVALAAIDTESSLKEYKKLRQKYPKFVDYKIVTDIARALSEGKGAKQAVQILHEAKEEDPGHSQQYGELIEAIAASTKSDPALEELRRLGYMGGKR